MKSKWKEIRKRGLALLLSVLMVVSGINIGGLGVTVVQADSESQNTPMNIEIPKQQYATKDQLLDECDLQYSNEEDDEFKKDSITDNPTMLFFGKNGEKTGKWLVAGADIKNGENTLALLSDYPFGEPRFFDEDSNNYLESDVRKFLQAAYEGSDYFSTAEKELMKTTTYSTVVGNSESSSSKEGTDVLYLPEVQEKKEGTTAMKLLIGVGNDIVIESNPLTFMPLRDMNLANNYFYFWTRTSVLDDDGLKVWRFYSSDGTENKTNINVSYEDIKGAYVVPAFDLDLSKVLFASSASEITGMIPEYIKNTTQEYNAETLRFDGTDMVTGNVSISSSGVDITKGSASGERVIVQGYTNPSCMGSSGTGWCYSEEVKEDKTISVNDIKEALSLSYTPDLSKCKVWIEKTVDSGLIYAKEAEITSHKVMITAGANMTKVSGADTQIDVNGAMETVTYTANAGYYFPEEYGLFTKNGITVSRENYQTITVSGTPTGDLNITITLNAATSKDVQSEPSDITPGVNAMEGTTTGMEYADSVDATVWYACSATSTSVAPGSWYVRFKETETKNASACVKVDIAKYYKVTINASEHMTKTENSGSAIQENVVSGMVPVTYEATGEYYFPQDYSVTAVNGIQVVRNSAGTITISGTPEDDATITLLPPSEKLSQEAPTDLSAGKGKIIGTTEGMEYTDDISGGTWKDCYDEKTITGVGTWFVRFKETDTQKPSDAETVEVTEEDDHKYTVQILGGKMDDITVNSSGSLVQRDVAGAMETVYVTAPDGYYFPEDYRVASVNGIKVERIDFTKIKISGTPSDDTIITLTSWTEKLVPDSPTGLRNGEGQILGTTAEMEYKAKLPATSKTSDCTESATQVDAGKYLVRYKATDTRNPSEYVEVTVSAKDAVVSRTTQFATVEQLQEFELSNEDSVEGKIHFGQGIEWYIAGSEKENSITILSTNSFGNSARFNLESSLNGWLNDSTLFTEPDRNRMEQVTLPYFDKVSISKLENVKLYAPDTASASSAGDSTIYAGTENQIPINVTHLPFSSVVLRSYSAETVSTVGSAFCVGRESLVVQSALEETKAGVVPAANINLSDVAFAASAPVSGVDGGSKILPTDAMNLRLKTNPSVISDNASVIYTPSDKKITVSDGMDCTLVVQSNTTKNNWYYRKAITEDEQAVYVSQIQSELEDVSIIDLTDCKIWIERTVDGETYALLGETTSKVTLTNPEGSHMTVRANSGTEIQTVKGDITKVVYQAEDGYYFPVDYKEQTIHGITVNRKSNSVIEVSGTPSIDTQITLEGAVKKNVTGKSVTLGSLGISLPNNSGSNTLWNGDRVYFGNHLWRVLEDSGLLFSEDIVEKASYQSENIGSGITWEESSLYQYLNNQYISNNFTTEEQNALQKYEEAEGKAFLLSFSECNNPYFGFNGDLSRRYANGSNMSYGWWLRSMYFVSNETHPQSVAANGVSAKMSNLSYLYDGFGVRPAINLDMEQVAFTTLLSTDKESFDLTTDKGQYNTWNVTLKGGTGFVAQRKDTAAMVESGDKATVSVTSIGKAKDGVDYSQLSAMLVDENGSVTAYGEISDRVGKGDVEVTIPEGTPDGDYKLMIFAEDVNSGKDSHETDYASNMVELSITVGENPEKLLSITGPAAIDVANGTALNAEMLGLPTKVTITTEDASVDKADVTWDVTKLLDNTTYDPYLLTEQTFVIGGTVELPEGLDQNHVELTTKITVKVVAADVTGNVVSDVANGTYTSDQRVTLSTKTEGADIYYTLDGTNPSPKTGEHYDAPILLNGEAGKSRLIFLKAMAVKDGMQLSEITTYIYLIDVPEKTYSVVVNSGSGDGSYLVNSMVTLKAEQAAEGYVFANWVVTKGEAVIFDSTNTTAVFSMPAEDIEVCAVYKCLHPVEKQEVKSVVEATCTTDGYSGDTYCTLCGDKIASGHVIPALGHKWGKVTYTWSDDYKSCTAKRICENDSTHVESEEAVVTENIKAATYHEAGLKTYTASFENAEFATQIKTEEIVQIICKHPTTEVRGAVKATCTKAGYTGDTYCTQCGDKVATGKAIAALGHSWSSWKVTKKATYTVTGVMTRTCSRCGAKQTKAIAKLKLPAKGKKVTVGALKYQITVSKLNGMQVAVIGVAKKSTTSISIPKTITIAGLSCKVTSIGNYACKGWKNLKYLTISENITTIGKQAFYGCKNLSYVTIKTTKLTTKSVGSYAFKGIKSSSTFKVVKSKLSAYKKLLLQRGVSSKVKFKS